MTPAALYQEAGGGPSEGYPLGSQLSQGIELAWCRTRPLRTRCCLRRWEFVPGVSLRRDRGGCCVLSLACHGMSLKAPWTTQQALAVCQPASGRLQCAATVLLFAWAWTLTQWTGCAVWLQGLDLLGMGTGPGSVSTWTLRCMAFAVCLAG